MCLDVRRISTKFYPDSSHIVTRFFIPEPESRVQKIIKKIIQLDEKDAKITLDVTLNTFSKKHDDIKKVFATHFNNVMGFIEDLGYSKNDIPKFKQLLIGAYFTKEDSTEASVFINPNILEDPDQSNLSIGQKRLIISFFSKFDDKNKIVFKKAILNKDESIQFQLSQEDTLNTNNKHKGSYEMVLPANLSERRLMGGARFAKFVNRNNETSFFTTLTASSGERYENKLIETKDFNEFEFYPLEGEISQLKEIALFPRMINNKYVMIGTKDWSDQYIMFSEQVNAWKDSQVLLEPYFASEFIKYGNIGSPIETDKGWLLLTYGVGPMMQNVLGAVLLDLEDPTKVIARLKEPVYLFKEEEHNDIKAKTDFSFGAIKVDDIIVISSCKSGEEASFYNISLGQIWQSMKVDQSQENDSKPIDSQQTIVESTHQKKNAIPHVLLVEDDKINQMIVSQILRSKDLKVVVANDGEIALAEIENGNFDLILSDINMPNYDGFELLKYLNQHAINIPVIFLTGLRDESFEIKSQEMGAVDFIQKPIDRKVLISKIEKVLG